MNKEKILIIEDEKDLVKILRYNLVSEGFDVYSAADGETGVALFREHNPHLVILDLMLPILDGYEVCKIIRRESRVPLVMLTAKTQEIDKILGLELGADDYITKPFSVREVIARVRAHLRRLSEKARVVTPPQQDSFHIDIDRHDVLVDGRSVRLTPREFEFLKCLVHANGRVISRQQLIKKVWSASSQPRIDARTVDQHIARLRSKLGSAAEKVVTIQNVGYRFNQA